MGRNLREIAEINFTRELQKMSACPAGVEWVNGRSLRKCWQVADRADWMLWLAGKAGIDRKLLVLAACDCAETSLKYVPEGEDRPRKAIETARAWCDGKASIADVRADAANAANAADAAAANAANAAAYAAAYAAYAADADADADAAAANAADDAADAANAAAGASRKAQMKMARLVRKRIPVDVIERAMYG